VFGAYELNHYVVIEGEPPPTVRNVLHAWLEQRRARALSSHLWLYRARTDEDPQHLQRKELSQRLREELVPTNQSPFRIHFLGPTGTGVFGYGLSASAPAENDDSGSIGSQSP